MRKMQKEKPHLPVIKERHVIGTPDFEIALTKELERCFPFIDTPEKREESANFFAKVIIDKCGGIGRVNYTELEGVYNILSRIKEVVGRNEREFIDDIIQNFKKFIKL